MTDSEVFKIAEFVINSDEIGDKEEAISTSHKMARWILDHRWRRVKDDPPEKNEFVIVFIPVHGLGIRDIAYLRNDGKWESKTSGPLKIKPSLWTPLLPQPPEEE